MIKNILTIILSVILLALIISWTFIGVVGTGEILYWIFTGDFFHFLTTSTSAF